MQRACAHGMSREVLELSFCSALGPAPRPFQEPRITHPDASHSINEVPQASEDRKMGRLRIAAQGKVHYF